MSGDMVAPDGPFEIDVKVHITDGERTGVVTVGMARGTVPTREQIGLAIEQASAVAEEQDMRTMDRHEFIQEIMGAGRIAVRGPKEFPS